MNKNVKITIKDIDRTKDISNWNETSDKINVTFLNGKTYSYNKQKIKIQRSALSEGTILSRFNYLKEIAKVVGLSDEKFGNTLLNQYEKINFLSQDSILSNFLRGTFKKEEKKCNFTPPPIMIYPFGFNLSQKIAVDNAFKNSLSIIEGPPGTGKTQTILNIIANAVVNKETVAIVSSNNSATTNIFEKLKKYNVDFISAQLGSSDNKKKFIELQTPLPNLSNWKITQEDKETIEQSLETLSNTLSKMLSNKNKLSQVQQELDSLELEYKHFSAYYNYSTEFIYLKPISSNISLELWLKCEQYIKQNT